jgi:hypothetical protein
VTISPEWAALILSLIVAVCGVMAWVLRGLQKEIADLKAALTEDVTSQGVHIQRLDDRLRQHTENEDRHTNKDSHKRLERIEDLLEKLLLNRKE